jgi:hypothetical protein
VIHGPRRTEIDARITPSQPAEEDDVVATALYLVPDVSAPTTGAVFSARTPFGWPSAPFFAGAGRSWIRPASAS